MDAGLFTASPFREALRERFVNQDADPYVYEHFRRLGTARFTRRAYLVNPTGGVEGGLRPFVPPRYERVHVPWKALLPPFTPERVWTADVCVPMHRVSAPFVERLLALPVPPRSDVRFCVCLDAPPSDAARRAMLALEARDGRLRVRQNAANVGASATRNRLLDECHSDYAIFLDDDVVPDERLLLEYCRAARREPARRGFVGLSAMPHDGRLWTDAIHVSTLYFWYVARHARGEPVAWGVTANLMVKWDPSTRFDPRFPKTGGGEDIDLCLQLGGTLAPVPDAKIVHPWRDGPLRMFRRLFEWAIGDGMLIPKHRALAYRAPPNAVELLLACLCARPAAAWIVPVAEALAHLFAELVLHPRLNGAHSHELLAEAPWPRRVALLLVGAAARATSDAGRLWGQLRRGELAHIGERFDWYAGRNPAARHFECLRAGALCAFALALTLASYCK